MNRKFLLASIDIVLFIVFSFVLDYFIYTIYDFNSTFIVTLLAQIALFIIFIRSYFNKNKIIYNIGIFLTFMCNVISCYYIYSFNSKYELVDSILFKKYEYNYYHLYAKKNTTYNSMEKLKNKKIGVLVNNYDNACSILKDNIKVECVLYYSQEEMLESLRMGEIQGFFIDDFEDSDKIIESDYRNLSSFKVKCTK